MKKLIMVLGVVLLVMGCRQTAKANEISLIDNLKKLPSINQAVIYSFQDNDIDYASTVTLVSLLNDKVKLDLGWTPKQEILGAVSFKLIAIKDIIDFPVLNWITIEPFVYVSYDRINGININQKGNSEFDIGAGCKILALKF